MNKIGTAEEKPHTAVPIFMATIWKIFHFALDFRCQRKYALYTIIGSRKTLCTVFQICNYLANVVYRSADAVQILKCFAPL